MVWAVEYKISVLESALIHTPTYVLASTLSQLLSVLPSSVLQSSVPASSVPGSSVLRPTVLRPTVLRPTVLEPFSLPPKTENDLIQHQWEPGF